VDLITGHAEFVRRPDFNCGGPPCSNLSPLSVDRKLHAECVSKGEGDTGKGYIAELGYLNALRVPMTLEEQVPFAIASLELRPFRFAGQDPPTCPRL
jgi:hypothetical protein